MTENQSLAPRPSPAELRRGGARLLAAQGVLRRRRAAWECARGLSGDHAAAADAPAVSWGT